MTMVLTLVGIRTRTHTHTGYEEDIGMPPCLTSFENDKCFRCNVCSCAVAVLHNIARQRHDSDGGEDIVDVLTAQILGRGILLQKRIVENFAHILWIM